MRTPTEQRFVRRRFKRDIRTDLSPEMRFEASPFLPGMFRFCPLIISNPAGSKQTQTVFENVNLPSFPVWWHNSFTGSSAEMESWNYCFLPRKELYERKNECDSESIKERDHLSGQRFFILKTWGYKWTDKTRETTIAIRARFINQN